MILPGIEGTDVGIEIDGEESFNDVQIFQTGLAVYDTGVKFGNTDSSKLIYPTSLTTHVAEFGEQSRNCGIVTDIKNIKDRSYTDEGATNPYVHVVGSATDDQLASVPTGVPTTVGYGVDANAPMVHDGDSWYASSNDRYDIE